MTRLQLESGCKSVRCLQDSVPEASNFFSAAEMSGNWARIEWQIPMSDRDTLQLVRVQRGRVASHNGKDILQRGTRFTISTTFMAIPSSLPKRSSAWESHSHGLPSLGFAHYQHHQQGQQDSGSPGGRTGRHGGLHGHHWSKHTKPSLGQRWSSQVLSGIRTRWGISISWRHFRGGLTVGWSTAIDRPLA